MVELVKCFLQKTAIPYNSRRLYKPSQSPNQSEEEVRVLFPSQAVPLPRSCSLGQIPWSSPLSKALELFTRDQACPRDPQKDTTHHLLAFLKASQTTPGCTPFNEMQKDLSYLSKEKCTKMMSQFWMSMPPIQGHPIGKETSLKLKSQNKFHTLIKSGKFQHPILTNR